MFEDWVFVEDQLFEESLVLEVFQLFEEAAEFVAEFGFLTELVKQGLAAGPVLVVRELLAQAEQLLLSVVRVYKSAAEEGHGAG